MKLNFESGLNKPSAENREVGGGIAQAANIGKVCEILLKVSPGGTKISPTSGL